ncbi:MAG: hypothetical protein U9P71_01270 [Campylobacterota bacterium]|nr:hypothetical protein [Campylobacterota bacterium]
MTYYYIHTGHRIGLDRFRRASAVISELQDADITLLTSDYRIASEAKNYGFKRGLGVDVVQNIAHIAVRGDQLIYDADEHSEQTLDDMMHFFSKVVRFSDHSDEVRHKKEFLVSPYLKGDNICNAVAIDKKFFGDFNKTIDVTLFYGDDDYNKDVISKKDELKALNMELLLGFYYFVFYDDEVGDSFKKIHENEEYEDVIKHSNILVTSSHQAVLDSLASGGRPVFIQRDDHSYEFQELFKTLNVPMVDELSAKKIAQAITKARIDVYQEVGENSNKIAEFIKQNLNL